MIRKAKRQLHAVRDDVVKKQLHAVREEVRQKQYHHHHQAEVKSQRHHAGGLKFSDIDPETKTKSHWMDEFEDDGDVSHLLSTNQTYHANLNSPLSKKEPAQPKLPAATNSTSVCDDLFAEDDHFRDDSSQMSTIQPASLATVRQQKEKIVSLFEDGPGLGDVERSLESDSKHTPDELLGSGDYEDLFSESALPIPMPKQVDLFKDNSPKQTLGFLSSGEYDNLFSDSPSSSSPVPKKESCDEQVIANEILKSSQASKQLLSVNGASDSLPSGREVVEAAVSCVTHNSGDEMIVKEQKEVHSELGAAVSCVTHDSGDETIVEEQREVHSEVVIEECEGSTTDKQSEVLDFSDVQFSKGEVPKPELVSEKSGSQFECTVSLQHEEEEEGEKAGRVTVASLEVTQESLESHSCPVSEEDSSLDNSMEFMSHLDESSTSPLPLHQSTEVPVETEKQPGQEVLEVECNGLSLVDPSEPSDKQALPHFPSSCLDVAIKLPHDSVEPTSSSFVALSDVSEHPLLGGEDTLNDWSVPASSLSPPLFLNAKPHSCTTTLEFKEDFYSQSPATVRKEVSAQKTTGEENSHPYSSTSSFSSSQSLSSSQQKLKKSTTGKLVPVVPPRPPCLSSSPKLGRKPDLGKRQESDTVSIASLTSVVSNDSVLLSDTASLTVKNVSSSSSSCSKTSVKEAFPDDTENNATLSGKSSDITGDAQQDIRSVSILSDMESAKVTVAPEREESGEFDYTLLVITLAILCLYLYYSLNPFVYLAGFLSGFLMFYLTVGAAFILYVQHSERELQRRKEANKGFPSLPNPDELPSNVTVDFERYRRLEGRQMSIVHRYHPNTHHPSKRISARVVLHDDFVLDVRYRSTVQTREGPVTKDSIKSFDLRNCSVLNVPEEVAQNRKRRWSKKFPILVSDNKSFTKVYLFVLTSRVKEEWFRRLRHASTGKTYDELVDTTILFNIYMSKYMPKRSPSNSYKTASLRPPHTSRSSYKKVGQKQAYSSAQHDQQQQMSATVSFLASSMSEKTVHGDSLVSIRSTDRRHGSKGSHGSDSLSVSQISADASASLAPLSFQLDWINAGMARLVWDVWHEEHWRRWVTSRIQRKLVRVKTPSFMEQLTVTDVHMGNDMPTIKGPFRPPELNQRGVWVYLVVEYRGDFTMTINTKLKLSAFDKLYYSSNSSAESPTQREPHHSSQGTSKAGHSKEMPTASNPDEGEDEISSGSDDEGTSADSHSLEENIHQEIMDKDSQPESTSGSTSPQASIAPSLPNKPAAVHVGRKQRILNSMVSKLQHMAVKSKMIQRAAEKVSRQSLVLTVRVRSLDGYLAVNMAPPPSDTLWFGFVKNPHLILDAKPKLGQREVTLSYVTDWIEKKLCELVEKKLVLPNMEDLVIPILTSGLQEDMNSKILSPS